MKGDVLNIRSLKNVLNDFNVNESGIINSTKNQLKMYTMDQNTDSYHGEGVSWAIEYIVIRTPGRTFFSNESCKCNLIAYINMSMCLSDFDIQMCCGYLYIQFWYELNCILRYVFFLSTPFDSEFLLIKTKISLTHIDQTCLDLSSLMWLSFSQNGSEFIRDSSILYAESINIDFVHS